ncbi:MAG: chromate transporter [Acidobacteriaceae bacterium]|nr:chromate transporter [Acidobacteriaceae bacterium]
MGGTSLVWDADRRMRSDEMEVRLRAGAGEVFLRFLRLGCTSFGGPVAHLGYLREEFVTRLGWLEEGQFAEFVGLCQFLPGPASSQVGFAIGMMEAGLAGGIAAWIGFTLPSALLMLGLALGHRRMTSPLGVSLLHGLGLAAVAVVAQAVWGMQKALAPNWKRMGIAVGAAVILLGWQDGWAQGAALLFGAFAGWELCRETEVPAGGWTLEVSRKAGTWAAAIFAGLLLVLPLVSRVWPTGGASLFAAFYRAGALVFGGGHVVLPLLERATVGRGWIDEATFLAGYGGAQAVPGPLFTFAGYLGAVCSPLPGIWGAALALVGIFLPGMLLVVAALPWWERLRRDSNMRAVVAGVNASVVGVLGAALYRPVATSAIVSIWDGVIVGLGFTALVAGKIRPWVVVAAMTGFSLTLR